MQIVLTHDINRVADQFRGLERQLPFAVALALTRTAQDVKTELTEEMRRVFDRPTPFTLRSLYLARATKANLEARVWLKDDFGLRAHYLMPQIEGGSRPLKRFESLLVQRGILGRDERIVPAAGARLDAYGNVSRGQIVQVLSQLSAFNLSGLETNNASNSRRSRAKRAAVGYFVVRRGTTGGRGSWRGESKVQHLPSGIWARYAFAHGNAIKPVFLFVNRTNYRPRYQFHTIGQAVAARRFAPHLQAALETALKTALLRQQGSLF